MGTSVLKAAVKAMSKNKCSPSRKSWQIVKLRFLIYQLATLEHSQGTVTAFSSDFGELHHLKVVTDPKLVNMDDRTIL